MRALLAGEWAVANTTPALAAAFTARLGSARVSPDQRRAWLGPGAEGTPEDDLVRLAVASYWVPPGIPPWEAIEARLAHCVDLERLGAAIDTVLAPGPTVYADPVCVLTRVGMLWGCGSGAASLRTAGYLRAFRDLGDVLDVARRVLVPGVEAQARQIVETAMVPLRPPAHTLDAA